MSRSLPTRRDLLLVIEALQARIGRAQMFHGNDRDPNGFEKGQNELVKAFNLCVQARGYEPPVEGRCRHRELRPLVAQSFGYEEEKRT